jgi:hypothetical protein
MIKTQQQAIDTLQQRATEIRDELFALVGSMDVETEFSDERIAFANAEFEKVLDNPELLVTFDRELLDLIKFDQKRQEHNAVLDTLKHRLIVPAQSADMAREAKALQAAGKLVSPAGFHPDDGVFIERA